jgi:hypothetical protein
VLQTANQSYASILGCFQNSFDIRQKKKKKIQDEKKKLLSAFGAMGRGGDVVTTQLVGNLLNFPSSPHAYMWIFGKDACN